MHAKALLHKWVSDVLPQMHVKRRHALTAVVSGVFRSGKLTVTGIGRGIRGAAKEKHNIKRADRLLTNRHLQRERLEVYAALCWQAVRRTKNPVILVDWSDVDARRKFFLLRAATPAQGRSLTLYEEVHGRATKEKRSTHRRFLLQLKELLPEGCKPIIITDAGFRGPWFKEVRALGWDFIGRVRNREKVCQADKLNWIGAKSLYSKANSIPKLLQSMLLTRSNPVPCSMALYEAKPKGRTCLGKMGKKRRNRTSLVSSARAREPWLLASSLAMTAEQIVKLYATRMQIEEGFRDLKCPRYGLSLYQNGTYKLERLRMLVMIGSLTATFAWLLGKTTQLSGHHRQFQANSVTHTNVLSAVFIGIQVFRNWRSRLSVRYFRDALAQLCILTQNYSRACQ